MKFTPIPQRPTQAASGAKSGVVCPGTIAKTLGFNPTGAWLFAYMFRRFGPPNIGSDDHKELASWCITTPKKGCYLTVTPYMGDNGDKNRTPLSFGYLLENPLHDAARTTPLTVKRERKAWWEKVTQWGAERGVSIVPDEELDKRKPLNTYPYGEEGPRWMVWSNKNDKDRPVEYSLSLLRKLSTWFLADLSSAYQKKHPKENRPPRAGENPRVIGQIDKAISATLTELMRPIFVRDIAFDPKGRVEETSMVSAEPYQHAGYPCQPKLPKKKRS